MRLGMMSAARSSASNVRSLSPQGGVDEGLAIGMGVLGRFGEAYRFVAAAGHHVRVRKPAVPVRLRPWLALPERDGLRGPA